MNNSSDRKMENYIFRVCFLPAGPPGLPCSHLQRLCIFQSPAPSQPPGARRPPALPTPHFTCVSACFYCLLSSLALGSPQCGLWGLVYLPLLGIALDTQEKEEKQELSPPRDLPESRRLSSASQGLQECLLVYVLGRRETRQTPS